MARTALKFGYNGRAFQGFSHQNIERPPQTVVMSILEALRTIQDKDGAADLVAVQKDIGFASASRTDRGVSALGNVLCLNTEREPEKLVRSLNSMVDNCFFWAYSPVKDDFTPKYASSRWYRYSMPDEFDDVEFARLERVAQIFYGKNDFRHFSKPDSSKPTRPTRREISLISLEKRDGSVILDVKAQSFLWHMVRMMVWALKKGAKEELSITTIYNLLNLEEDGIEIGLASAEPLVLMDVDYQGVEFKKVAGIKKGELFSKIFTLKTELDFLDLAVEKLDG